MQKKERKDFVCHKSYVTLHRKFSKILKTKYYDSSTRKRRREY